MQMIRSGEGNDYVDTFYIFPQSMADSVRLTCRCVTVGVMLGNVGNSSHILRTDKYSLPAWTVWAQIDHDPATVVADFGCG